MSATKGPAAAATIPMTTKAAAPAPASPAQAAPRRRRRGLKRLEFQVPAKMPLPVKALWQQASEEARARAHRTATAILRTWLGKASREEAAKELGLSAVRLWQLSQQAVCGLVVGCLRQPRYRGRPPAGGYGGGEEGVGALRKRIATLERELDGSRRLIEVMQDLPGHREAKGSSGSEASGGHGGTGGGARRSRGAAAADRGATTLPGAEAPDGPRG